MAEEKTHIVPYKTYLFVLFALLALTGISVAVTQIELGTLTVMVALLLATIKASLVLIYFMHLKFDSRFFAVMVSSVILLIAIVLFITFLDYFYR